MRIENYKSTCPSVFPNTNSFIRYRVYSIWMLHCIYLIIFIWLTKDLSRFLDFWNAFDTMRIRLHKHRDRMYYDSTEYSTGFCLWLLIVFYWLEIFHFDRNGGFLSSAGRTFGWKISLFHVFRILPYIISFSVLTRQNGIQLYAKILITRMLITGNLLIIKVMTIVQNRENKKTQRAVDIT